MKLAKFYASLVTHFDIPALENIIKESESLMEKDDFWDDQKGAMKVVERLNLAREKKNQYDEVAAIFHNVEELLSFALVDLDSEVHELLDAEYSLLEEKLNVLKMSVLFSGPFDELNAILEFHPGAGGTESQDWAEMLYRMYTRWATKNGFEIQELDYLEGDEAGLKSVTFEIIGENAYGYMKCEKGVHRLVRISPFDAGGRRHTSFASLEVLPEITDDIELDINPEDIKMDVYRASGAGGQHVNKTSSAVRLTHIPTGVVVACQTERSQFQNKDMAMKMLKSKLLDLKEREQKETIAELKGEQRDIAWGSQIRSYVFCPYTLVKDHRTNYEVGNVEAVMNGEIDDFIEACLKNNIN